MTETQPPFFNKQRIREAFDRAADSYDAAAVLQKEVCARLLEKLEYIRLDPATILDAGTGTGEAIVPLHEMFNSAEITGVDISEKMLEKTRSNLPGSISYKSVRADIEALPFDDHSFDLVFCNLALQWCNDVQAALMEFKRVLNPGGLVLFTLFGPDTLKELRTSWQAVDDAVHVNAFYDMHDVGDAMHHCGFADTVMDAEYLTVTYEDVFTLMKDLRDIGANVTASGHRRGLLTRNQLASVVDSYERYRRDGVLPATYEVIYGHAWQPETSPGTVHVDLK